MSAAVKTATISKEVKDLWSKAHPEFRAVRTHVNCKKIRDLGILSECRQDRLRGAESCAIGVQSRNNIIDSADEVRPCHGIVEKTEGFSCESFGCGEMLDELTNYVRGRLSWQSGISRRILFIVVEDIDDAQTIDIDDAAADFKS